MNMYLHFILQILISAKDSKAVQVSVKLDQITFPSELFLPNERMRGPNGNLFTLQLQKK